MAFDAEFKSVYNTFTSIDSKIEKDDERNDFHTQKDLMELQDSDQRYIQIVRKAGNEQK